MSRRYLFLLLLTLFANTVTAGDWPTDYAQALEKAKAENKRVLLDFTGSDWCGPCIQFAHDVLSRPEFVAYAQKNLILVEVDYPRRKKQSPELVKQNEQLAHKYRIDGYPTVVLLDPAGKILREFTGYDGESVAEFLAWLEGNKK